MNKKIIFIKKNINTFKKQSISVDGDKSLSIRLILLSSLSDGKCNVKNLLMSEDVLSAVSIMKKLGIKIRIKKKVCEIIGRGLFGLKFKKNLILDSGNSGTTARLICGLLSDAKYWVKITGDNSLKKRDMSRIIKPLKLFGTKFKNNRTKLPIYLRGPEILKPIKYFEKLGSAQCKSALMIAALKTSGKTELRCLPSRNHTEIIFKKVLNLPIKVKKKKNYDFISILGNKKLKKFNYKIPGDISSASFFIVLTLLSKNNFLRIKNVNINPSRIGILNILNLMGAKIKILNKKLYKGEPVADIFVKSTKNLKAIKLKPKLNSFAIDEFLLIFLVSCVSKGVSTFRNLSELNKKESKRLDWGIKILRMIGIKVKIIRNNGVKIWGQPNLILKKKYVIKNFSRDHRVFMTAAIAALALGGSWKIYDRDCFKTSFPKFITTLNLLGAKINEKNYSSRY